MAGPLGSMVVVEVGGIGPTPYCGMLLADLGATVIRLHRPGTVGSEIFDRGKHVIECDLKTDGGRAILLDLAGVAEAVIEGFRPGVMERLGVGPESLWEVNRRLVVGRMTGWGQEGPRAATVGHDIDYLAVAGVLGAIGSVDRPIPPLNLVADFGGGALFLALGVVAAVMEARELGEGQVVDAAMVDGVAHLSTMFHVAMSEGWWTPRRESNLLDGAAPFYTTYRCADGEHVAVGALEPQFFADLLAGLEVDPDQIGGQMDRERWPSMRERFAEIFAARTRTEWVAVFADTDACVAPVNSLIEAVTDPHLRERHTFREEEGGWRPAPAPRFSRHTSDEGRSLEDALVRAGMDRDRIYSLSKSQR